MEISNVDFTKIQEEGETSDAMGISVKVALDLLWVTNCKRPK